VAWTAPVLAPIICSLTMVLLALSVFIFRKEAAESNKTVGVGAGFSGSFYDFLHTSSGIIPGLLFRGFTSKFFDAADNPHFQEIIAQYRPTHYHWDFFVLGEIFIACAFGLTLKQMKSTFHHIENKIE